jgi:hypothetical protein
VWLRPPKLNCSGGFFLARQPGGYTARSELETEEEKPCRSRVLGHWYVLSLLIAGNCIQRFVLDSGQLFRLITENFTRLYGTCHQGKTPSSALLYSPCPNDIAAAEDQAAAMYGVGPLLSQFPSGSTGSRCSMGV